MKLYDVCIKGFVKGNLGDDLFIDILCKRYPNTKFVICAEKAYKKCFSELPNLKYISYDALMIKVFFRILKVPVWCINKVLIRCGIEKRFAYLGCDRLVQALSRENVLISGSLFMELQDEPFTIGPNQVKERKYYRRKPYVIGCNFGPYYNEEYREFYQQCFRNAKQVCFREKYSCDLFDGDNMQWGADIVFTYPKERIVTFAEKNFVAISVLDLNKDLQRDNENVNRYITAISDAVNVLTKRGEYVILVGFCNAQGDDKVIQQILKGCMNSEHIAVYNYPSISYREMLGILAGAKAIISTRYHGMILGWLFEKKVLPVVYSSKMQHVIDDIDSTISVCNVYDELFTGDKLIKGYDEMMETKYKIDIDRLVESAQTHFEKLDKVLK